jgi:hypothetical protein
VRGVPGRQPVRADECDNIEPGARTFADTGCNGVRSSSSGPATSEPAVRLGAGGIAFGRQIESLRSEQLATSLTARPARGKGLAGSGTR